MNWRHICLISLLIQLLFTPCYNYRILAIFPVNGRSHFNVLGEIAKALAEKGNQVDVISVFPLKEKFPNYTDLITIPKTYNDENLIYNDVKSDDIYKIAHEICLGLCGILEQPEMRDLINNPPTDPPYDLVLIHLIPAHVCFSAIGHLWKVPVVSVATSFLYPYNDHCIGTPLNLAVSPRNQRVYKENMTFWDRLYNFVMTHLLIWTFRGEEKNEDPVVKKYFGDRVPHYTVLQESVSLILSNSHPSLHGIRPKVPALIEIGGIHIVDDNSTVEPTLQSVMDISTEGFIYVSFGSRILIETVPEEVVRKLFRVYEKLAPIQIIMKSKNPELLVASVPKNVHFFPWLPQKKMLQHHKIKAFVTHGGALSIQEALYFGIPIICVPIFYDQFTNCDIAANKKIGLKLDITTAEQEDYFNVFNNILNDSTYVKASRKLSSLYRDRLVSPRQEAVYWIEYVIRHGRNALKSPTVDLEWWQIELLDVLAFIALVTLLVTGIAIFALKQLFRLILSRSASRSNAQPELIKKLN